MAEIRFRAALGRSILSEIRNVRLETAKTLLANRTTQLGFIANRCGYRSLAAFSVFFRTETGVTPSGWRNGLR
ncbi:MAG: HTH-type transcriptional activator RhaR [Verrucomicrobia bacterium ADurb.Bin070]|nr:MAG: HTH-type transcriptional activator RhaR [Verrucomicrobia bacterium ADurb.Bin070]